MATAAAKKATATGTRPNAVAPIAASRISTGTMPRRTLPRSSDRSASGSRPKSRRNCGSEVSLPCSTTTSPSLSVMLPSLRSSRSFLRLTASRLTLKRS